MKKNYKDQIEPEDIPDTSSENNSKLRLFSTFCLALSIIIVPLIFDINADDGITSAKNVSLSILSSASLSASLLYISSSRKLTQNNTHYYPLFIIAVSVFLLDLINTLFLSVPAHLSIPSLIKTASAMSVLIASSTISRYQVLAIASHISILIVTILALPEIYGERFIPYQSYGLVPALSGGSSLGNPNFAASYLLGAIPLALLAFPLMQQKKQARTIGILKMSVITAGIIFLIATQSRGAWLGFMSSIILFTSIYKGFSIRRKYYLILGLLLIVPSILFLIYPDRVNSLFNSSHRSNAFRRYIWSSTAKMISENPLAGSGAGTYRHAVEPYRHTAEVLLTRNEKIAEHPHSQPLLIMAESGLVGLSVTALLLLYCWQFPLKAALSGDIRGLFIITGLFGISVHALVSAALAQPSSTLFFWLLTGLGVALFSHSYDSCIFKFNIHSENSNSGYSYVVYPMILISISLSITAATKHCANHLLGKAILTGSRGNMSKKLDYALNSMKLFKDPQSSFRAAEASLALGDYQAAIDYAQITIKLSPNTPAGHDILGVALMNTGGNLKAEKAFKSAIKARGGPYTSAMANLGALYLQRGGNIQAEELLRKAVKFRPSEYKAHANLGLLLARKGQSEEAEKHLKLASDAGDPSAMYNLGLMKMLKNDSTEAELLFSIIRNKFPQMARTWSAQQRQNALNHEREDRKREAEFARKISSMLSVGNR